MVSPFRRQQASSATPRSSFTSAPAASVASSPLGSAVADSAYGILKLAPVTPSSFFATFAAKPFLLCLSQQRKQILYFSVTSRVFIRTACTAGITSGTKWRPVQLHYGDQSKSSTRRDCKLTLKGKGEREGQASLACIWLCIVYARVPTWDEVFSATTPALPARSAR